MSGERRYRNEPGFYCRSGGPLRKSIEKDAEDHEDLEDLLLGTTGRRAPSRNVFWKGDTIDDGTRCRSALILTILNILREPCSERRAQAAVWA
jgi:hypothetical protein